jgi:hypothetical protein
MPSSYVGSVPSIVNLMIDLSPRSIIDIGPGWGKYGLMAREYLPNLAKLDAVEVKEGARPTQTSIYDTVIWADVRTLNRNTWGAYNMAFLIDVIEHMEQSEGHRLLRDIVSAGTIVVVATPKLFIEQHDDDNPYETHLSLWGWEDFGRYRLVRDVSTIDAIIYALGE